MGHDTHAASTASILFILVETRTDWHEEEKISSMPYDKTKAQSGLTSFCFVSHGVLSWWLHTKQQCWSEETLGPTVSWLTWVDGQQGHGKEQAGACQPGTSKCRNCCLLQEGEWRMILRKLLLVKNEQLNCCLCQFLNCYPLLLLTLYLLPRSYQNSCDIFGVGFLTRRKGILALKRTQWQKKRK